jgi:hypothetical protein
MPHADSSVTECLRVWCAVCLLMDAAEAPSDTLASRLLDVCLRLVASSAASRCSSHAAGSYRFSDDGKHDDDSVEGESKDSGDTCVALGDTALAGVLAALWRHSRAPSYLRWLAIHAQDLSRALVLLTQVGVTVSPPHSLFLSRCLQRPLASCLFPRLCPVAVCAFFVAPKGCTNVRAGASAVVAVACNDAGVCYGTMWCRSV